MAAQLISLLIVLNRIWSHGKPVRRRRATRNGFTDVAVCIEQLEERRLLSTNSVLSHLESTTTYELANNASPAASVSYNPSKMLSAYGFDKLSYTGAGQTIAIVDAYHSPTILTDLQKFDAAFGLADPPSFKVISQTGSTTNLPATDPTKGWEVEAALDVQWAHALAPGANIVLVEANSASDADLFAAVTTAANLPGVSVVSMSFGGSEFSSEANYDSIFKTPTGHQGVTFIASTGDNGAPGGFPAYSSNVLAVGGTTLTLDSSGHYVSESAWSGSGGGISQYESQPVYQKGIVTQTTTKRAIPDVAFDADPNSGVPVVASFTYGSTNPWATLGGTSFSAPAWAAIIAIVNEARADNGLSSLDGATQTLPMLYQLSTTTPSAFHDITTGNNGFAAGAGYDLATGLGTPVVDVLVPAMSGASTQTASKLVVQSAPTTGTAGTKLAAVKVAVETASGHVVTTDTSTVTLTLSSGTFSNGLSTVTATAVNGIATFDNLTINVSGTYQLTASTTGSVATAKTGNVVISAGAVSSLTFQQTPSSAAAGIALAPAIKVAATDQYGNLVSTSTSVTLKLTGGTFSTGNSTLTATTSNGVATFSKIIIKTAGSYSLSVSAASVTGPSFDLSVSRAPASKLAWVTAPSASAVAGALLDTVAVAVVDAFGNVVTTDNSTVTLTISTGTFGTGSATMSTTAVNGIATFYSPTINLVGTYKITASDSASLTAVSSSNILIKAGALSSLVVQQAPTTGTAGVALGSVKVAALDAFGNLISDTSTVTLTAAQGGNSVSKTATLSHGNAMVTGLTLTTAGNYSLTASIGSIAASPFNVTVNPATGKQPVWIVSPSDTAVAGTIMQPMMVAVLDAFGNLATTSNTTVTLKIAGAKFGNGSASISATSVAGFAIIDNVSINTAGTFSLSVAIGSLATDSSSVTVTAAFPAKLIWKTAPAGNAVAGATLDSIVVAVEDTFGNVVTTNDSAVTLTINSGTFESASSTVTVNAVNGLATFDDVAIDIAGTYKLTASDSASLTTVTSGNVVITPASLSSLSIVQAPSSAVAGVAFAPIVKVAALDAYGNLITAQTTVTLTLHGGNFSSNANTVTATTSKGIASFSGLIIKTAGEYSLTASAGELAGPTTGLIVTAAAGKTPVWVDAPSSSGTAGQTLDPVTALVNDAFGNLANASSTTVTMKITGGKFADGSTSKTATTDGGFVAFNNLVINTAGTYTLTAYVGSVATSSSTVTIAAADPAKLVWQTAPVAKAVAGTSLNTIVVAVKDTFGNLVTTDNSTVTLTLSSATFGSGSATVSATATNGIATFSGLAINQSGTYTMTASDSESLTTVTSGNVVISPASLNYLALVQSPDSATAGTALNAVKVAALDQYGNLVSGSTSVTLTLTGGKFSTNSATATATTTGGIATFSNLTIKTVGDYTIASSAGSTPGPSFNFTVNPAAASKLVWVAAPSTKAVAGTTLNSIVLAVQDAFGNQITTDDSAVTLSLGGGTFSDGTTTATAHAVNGIVEFDNLSINKAGSYKFTASDGSLTTAISGNLVVSPSSLSNIVIQQAPTSVTAGIALSPIKVAAVDQFGNVLANATNVTLSLSSGAFADGHTSVTLATSHGLATFSGLIINAAANYTLTVSSESVTGGSASVTVNPAAGKQAAWQTPPASTATAGVAFDPVVVAVLDAFGNLVTNSTTNVIIKITGGKFSNGMTSITASSVNGYATFNNLTISAAGSYTLTATVGSATTSGVTVTVNAATV